MITAIDHIVLTSADVDKTIAFYCEVLGMELQVFAPLDGGPARRALCFGNQKINIHAESAPYIPHARRPVSGRSLRGQDDRVAARAYRRG